MVKVPDVERCCFCCPLRKGIMLFGIINIIFSLAAVAWLVYTTELKKAKFLDGSLEEATSTVLFSIFGMSVILNILLLFAGYQKDIAMLRLFNCYAIAISLAAMVPTFILLSRAMYYDTGVALFAIAMQCYVIVLVRSEVLKLERKISNMERDHSEASFEDTIDVGDAVTLL